VVSTIKKYALESFSERINNYVCVPLTLNGAILSYVYQCKYLGIVLTSFRYFKCSFDHVKLKFYKCLNTSVVSFKERRF